MKITKDFNLKWNKFKHDKRAFTSFIVLLILFIITTPAEFICNTRPIILVVEGKTFIPVLFSYSEKDFGGPLLSEPDYLSKRQGHYLFQGHKGSELVHIQRLSLPYDD
jgi:ABC-type microcin C transport system permease subunit YejE